MAATVATPPILMTAEEFVARHENDRMELVNGIVVEIPMPYPNHGKVCFQFTGMLWKYLETNDIGQSMGNDSFMRTTRTPDSVRGA